MSRTTRQYGEQEILREYTVFLVGAVLIGFIVVWAEIPHGTFRALIVGTSTACASAVLATVAFIRRRRTWRLYVTRLQNRSTQQ
ncbi:MAG: hypothetical protein K6T83_14060 [Alicyclobacillus sp.]|nr:hypothetical protein [Alicyclobacillus sp.]